MKAFALQLGALALLLLLAGCETDVPAEPREGPGSLQRGITGQGTLYQPDRTSDPIIREESRVGY